MYLCRNAFATPVMTYKCLQRSVQYIIGTPLTNVQPHSATMLLVGYREQWTSYRDLVSRTPPRARRLILIL